MTVANLPAHWAHVPPRDQRDWVTAHELTIEAGLSYRRVDYWTRTGLLTALPGSPTAARRVGDLPITPETPGSGYLRRYRTDQITRARTLRDLLDAGVSLVTCRQVIDDLLATGHATLGAITLTHQPTTGGAA